MSISQVFKRGRERIALAQQALLREARLESGLFQHCLKWTLDSAGQAMVLMIRS